ncbi:MAG TPA: hypothetical protein PKH94_06595 [Bacteroidales bacterium]|nr:hypothetical protein [Bacteroidales bacterium]HNS46888.1 hypothetical protein [Bacteroidales bacterium]
MYLVFEKIFYPDEPVFNIPRVGKFHLRDWQDHELSGIRASGEGVFRFYPWESKVTLVDDQGVTSSFFTSLISLQMNR